MILGVSGVAISEMYNLGSQIFPVPKVIPPLIKLAEACISDASYLETKTKVVFEKTDEVLALRGSPVQRPDGTVSIKDTIGFLDFVGANTYDAVYGYEAVNDKNSNRVSFNGLQQFCASAPHINFRVVFDKYNMPKLTERETEKEEKTLIQKLGELSKGNNFKGVILDDTSYNFNKEGLSATIGAARKNGVKLMPTYYSDETGSENHLRAFSSVLFGNLYNEGSLYLRQSLSKAIERFQKYNLRVECILFPPGNSHFRGPIPPEELEQQIRTAVEFSDGVVLWEYRQIPNNPQNAVVKRLFSELGYIKKIVEVQELPRSINGRRPIGPAGLP